MSQKGFGFIQKAQSMVCQGALGKLQKQAWFAPPSEFFPSISAPAPSSAVPGHQLCPTYGNTGYEGALGNAFPLPTATVIHLPPRELPSGCPLS